MCFVKAPMSLFVLLRLQNFLGNRTRNITVTLAQVIDGYLKNCFLKMWNSNSFPCPTRDIQASLQASGIQPRTNMKKRSFSEMVEKLCHSLCLVCGSCEIRVNTITQGIYGAPTQHREVRPLLLWRAGVTARLSGIPNFISAGRTFNKTGKQTHKPPKANTWSTSRRHTA